MRRLTTALANPQPLRIRRRSVTLQGVLAGVAGNLMIDLGRTDQAAGMFKAGQLAGHEAEDADLAAWVTATASIGPYYAGHPHQAAMMLDEAAGLSERASGPRRRAWISALCARALAATGERAR